MSAPSKETLSGLPFPFKWLATLMLASYAMTHGLAAILVWEVTTRVDSSAQEHFAYKTFAALLRMAHQHTFGHGTMYFLTGALFLLCGLPNRIAVPVVTGAFLGAWLDHASWFGLKYFSARWELLSMASGAAYAACFAFMAAAILWRMWVPSRPRG